MSENAYTKDDVRVIRELYKQFVEAFASAPQSLLDEALPSAELALAIEDRGWIRFDQIGAGNEFNQQLREEIVRRARVHSHLDPLSKQAIRLWTTYAFGRGLTFKSESASDQKILNSFWKFRLNRRIFRADGQHTSSRKLLTDGEVFFAIFANQNRPPVVRRLNPLEITNVYSDPDDAERPIFYERLVNQTASVDRLIANSTNPATLYYADFQNFYSPDDIPQVRDNNSDLINGREQENVWILHIALDPDTLRGHSLLESIIDWSKNHNKFMDSRVAVMLAMAQFARRIRATGSAPAFGAIKDQFRTGWTPEGGEIGQPPIPPGSTWMEKEGLTLEQMPPETAAANARNDGDMLKLMVCAGTNIMLHYFGDPKTGNLATATAMELPMLKTFECYQQLWSETYTDLLQFVLDVSRGTPPDEDAETPKIDVDFPPIVQTDIAVFAAAFEKFTAAIPALAEDEDVRQQVLMALNVEDVETALKNIEKLSQEIERKRQAELATTQPQPIQTGGSPRAV